MKRAAAFLLVAAGCSAAERPAPSDEAAFEMALATQLAYDPALVKVGDWAAYAVRVRGSPKVEYYRWAAVGEENGAIWIENRRPAPPNPSPMIVKSKIDRAGKLLEQWVGVPGGRPGRSYPGPEWSARPPAQRRDSSVAALVTREESESLAVGGRTYSCTKVTTELTYPDGRRSVMVNWLSHDVPFPVLVGGKPRGGLVRRQVGRLTVDLLEHGGGARPELTISTKD